MSDVTLVSTTSDVTVISTAQQVLFVQVGVQGPAGPSAHSELSGLAGDDHPQYHTDARGDARYAPLAHVSDTANPHAVTKGQVGLGEVDNTSDPNKPVSTAQAAADAAVLAAAEPVGSSAAAVSAHAAGTGVHAIASVTGLQTALDGKSSTSHSHADVYEPIGSTNTHAVLTTTHGISSFGATLVDDANASSARTTLGLGNAATASIGTTTGTVAAGDDYRFSQYDISTGGSNSHLGNSAQYSLTTGIANNGFGYAAQYSLTTGGYNNGFGYTAQYSLTTGGYNTGFGHNAQKLCADGSSANVFSNCTHVGTGTKISANNVNNETAIGYEAVGIGSNTVAIGNSSVIRTGLRGSIDVLASSSTTENQITLSIFSGWVNNTHAIRSTRTIFSAPDYTGLREILRIESDGTQGLFGAFGAAAVPRPSPITAQLTAISHTAPSTLDYTIQAMTPGGYGFATQDEAHTILSVLKNLQDRVSQMETALKNLGWLS